MQAPLDLSACTWPKRMLPSAAEFLFVACPPEPCAGCPPPHSATTTLLPHPPMLERWVSRSPPVLHQQRRNSVEELTLLTIGQNGINNRLWGAARGRKPCYSKVFAAPRSTKGSSSLECRPLLTYLPAKSSTNNLGASRISYFPPMRSNSTTARLLPNPMPECDGRIV